MSTFPNRTLLKSVLLLAMLLPLISLSQVKIKEKVEIGPRAKVASTASDQLTFVFHWTALYSLHEGKIQRPMHLSVIEPSGATRGFDVNTGMTAGVYSEVITNTTTMGSKGIQTSTKERLVIRMTMRRGATTTSMALLTRLH